MAEQDPPDLDPELARAYRAERALATSIASAHAGAHERILLAALARVASAPPPPPPFWSTGRVAVALVASSLLSAGLGFFAGRRPAPVETPVPMVAPASPPDAGVPDASPPDAGAPDAEPAPKRRPRQASGELNEPLLIDQARAALRRRLVDEALEALQQHEARFPAGQLVEEREVLYIEAELMKGRRAQARERIRHYRERFPYGFLRTHVDSLLPDE